MDVFAIGSQKFVYDTERTFDQNFNEWFYQCNDERETWGEELLNRDDAFALFEEYFKDHRQNG